MRKKNDPRKALIPVVLALTVLTLTACSTMGQTSKPATNQAPQRATAVALKESIKPPTEPPTEAPTEPPTEAPTDPPTEAPTDPPTNPPTEPPTERVIHVATQLDTSGIVPDYAAEMIGRTIWGEAGGVENTAERAAVAWCILNRADAWDMTIEQVILEPGQFHGYRDAANWGECPPEHIELAQDVLYRWAAEKYDIDYTGRVLPPAYLYFWGDGEHNYFSTEYLGTDYWEWSGVINPYT